jgi:hypothetical protein
MEKRKTALQSLINELNEEASKLQQNQYSWHCLMTIIEMAESKLPQEKQDLIDAFDEGSNATSWDSFEEAYDITPSKEEYFNQTFENER